MNHITVKDVTKLFRGKTVLDHITLTLNGGEKVALVGENGSGKTTMLKILAGHTEPDSGSVASEGPVFSEYVEYVPQEPFAGEQGAGLEYVHGDSVMRRVLRSFKTLGLDENLLCLNTVSLSGGQKKILSLAIAFAKNPPFLLLDEPENHLDYFNREWLIEMMEHYRGGLMFVSHDQFVVDAVATKIVEIENAHIQAYPGEYRFFLEERKRQLEGRFQQWKHAEKEIDRHKTMVIQLRQKAKRFPKLSGNYQSKVKLLEKLIEKQIPRPVLDRPRIKIDLAHVDQKKSKRILRIEDMHFAYGDNTLFRGVNAQLTFGEKVCLFGKNGSGKSSLFRLIVGQLEPDKGSVKLGVDLRVGYLVQESHEDLDPNQTPLSEIERTLRFHEHRARVLLDTFLIKDAAMTAKISSLSGGQKTRLRFAKLFSSDAEFLILDEPTNHLDRSSWEVLVNAVKEFKGTVLLSSHDRMFIDQAVSKLWILEQGLITDFPGNLSEFIER